MRILIAEDNRVSREALRGLLESWGHEVVVASDGDEAWQVLQAEDSPRLAILDWMMPGLDGAELCRRTRRRAAGDYVYVLLLTAKGQKEDLVEGMGAGADDYLVKPFDPPELKARLQAGRRILDLKAQVEAEGRAREEETRRHFQQLAQSQKLTAIGQLAAGIAHEINTPAQYLQANLDFLLDSLGDVCGTLERVDRALSNSAAGQREHLREARAALEGCDVSFLTEEIPQALEQSREGVATISRIVQAMRHFSRPGTEDTLSAVDLNQTLQSVVTVSRHEWKNVAELHLELDPELPEIDCVAGPINQVLLQILTNAAHAVCEAHGGSGPKGVITIATEHRPPWAVVRISDTGVGMSEEVRSRVFEPFFTTREVGSGSGQGLAVAYDTVVNKHGGSLSVESEPGRGATFEVRLPLREAESGARAAERGRPAAAWS